MLDIPFSLSTLMQMFSIICGILFCVILAVRLLQGEKMNVDVITEQGVKQKKYKIDGNKLLIRKERKRGSVAYAPTFSKASILNYMVGFPFKRLKQKVMLFEDADECIKFNNPDVEKAVWDRKAEEKLWDANVIKASGQTQTKVVIPAFVYMLLVLMIAFQVIDFILSTGTVRIG